MRQKCSTQRPGSTGESGELVSSVPGSSPVRCSCRKTAHTACAKSMTHAMIRGKHVTEPQGLESGKHQGTTSSQDARPVVQHGGNLSTVVRAVAHVYTVCSLAPNWRSNGGAQH